MRDYVVVVLALVAFVLVFNSINGTREEKFNMKHMQSKSANCIENSTAAYVESVDKVICVPKRNNTKE